MILIKKYEDKVTISGHANYSDGEDIVCASVSSIMYTTVNAILRFDESAIDYIDDKSVVTIKIKNKNKTTNILIDNMISLYNELSSNYPKNVKVESEE